MIDIKYFYFNIKAVKTVRVDKDNIVNDYN